MGATALSGALWLGLLWAGSGAGGSCQGKCCQGRDAACVGEGWREGGGYGTCYCDGGCRRAGDCCHDHGQACPVHNSWNKQSEGYTATCQCGAFTATEVVSCTLGYLDVSEGSAWWCSVTCLHVAKGAFSVIFQHCSTNHTQELSGKVFITIPCVVGEWSHWSGCAEQCHPGLRIRRRYVQQEPQNGGEPCPALEEKAGCLEYLTYQGEDCGHEHVPAFITSSEYGKERKRRAASSLWPSDKEAAGYCVEFRTESLSHHCALETRPYARWMQYLREGHTVCVACQPPAMSTATQRCSGDGHNAHGDKILHWEAIGNSQCQGTWKKIRQLERCSCPLVHSFIFT